MYGLRRICSAALVFAGLVGAHNGQIHARHEDLHARIGASANASSTANNSTTAAPTDTLQYEYIIVGSGAGGGVLATRLAELGHEVLLIEAGEDEVARGNVDVSVPGYQVVVTQDPAIRWDMYVSHYQDLQRATRDPKHVYTLPDSIEYIGLDPLAGAKPKGIL